MLEIRAQDQDVQIRTPGASKSKIIDRNNRNDRNNVILYVTIPYIQPQLRSSNALWVTDMDLVIKNDSVMKMNSISMANMISRFIRMSNHKNFSNKDTYKNNGNNKSNLEFNCKRSNKSCNKFKKYMSSKDWN
ncbi:hypothetical protein BGZ83_010447 [Gryganskiella cystojenkinii]|nr:hypothetical protein BGZ83_010447 [Gryganskiella cystojenkinii]